MIPYVDASALVKRYVHETGTAAVRRILADGVPATSRLAARVWPSWDRTGNRGDLHGRRLARADQGA